MPLTKSERKIMRSMKRRYGSKRGKRIFYASATKGVLGSKTRRRHGARRRRR
jgi:hypothetical protein